MRGLLSVACMAILAMPALASAQGERKPASLEEVEKLVRRGVPHRRILTLLEADCVDFQLDGLKAERLRAAGATDTFLSRLGGVCVRHAPPAPPSQPPPPVVVVRPEPVVAPQPLEPVLQPVQEPAPAESQEMFIGGRLELPVSESESNPRGYLSLELMTRPHTGWRVGVGVAGARVISEDDPPFFLLRVDARLSYTLFRTPGRFGLQAYGTVGTLFALTTQDRGARLSGGLAMDLGIPLRLYMDLAHEWRPERLPFEPQSTLLSLGLSLNLSRGTP